MSVCEAYILASKMEETIPYFKMSMLLKKPKTIGMIKASIPNTMALPRIAGKSSMFISKPAKNMM